MTISAERIVMEVEKIFLSPNSVLGLNSLEFLRPVKYMFAFFPVQSQDLDFLWAAYILLSENKLEDFRLGNAREERILNILKHASFPQKAAFFEPDYELFLKFSYAVGKANQEDYLHAFGPWSSPKEKLKYLGVDGEFLMSKGIEKGPRLKAILDNCLEEVIQFPDIRFKYELETLTDFNISDIDF